MRVALVRLYPREWRRRYEDELIELLATRSLTVATVADTVRGAADAHLHLDRLLVGPRSAEMRARSASSAAMTGWVMLGIAAAGVAKSTEDPAFATAAHSHPMIAVTRLLAVVAFGIATVALAVGGAGVVAVAAKQFWGRRDRLGGGLLIVPVAAVVVVLAAGVGAGRMPAGPVHGIRTLVLAAALMLVAGAGAVACVLAGIAVVGRTDLPAWLQRGLGWAIPVAAAAMALAFLSGCVYGLAVWIESPRLFESDDGIVATYLPVTWVVLLVVAALAVALTTRSAVRGLRVGRSA